jgi:hypothetical protein
MKSLVQPSLFKYRSGGVCWEEDSVQTEDAWLESIGATASESSRYIRTVSYSATRPRHCTDVIPVEGLAWRTRAPRRGLILLKEPIWADSRRWSVPSNGSRCEHRPWGGNSCLVIVEVVKCGRIAEADRYHLTDCLFVSEQSPFGVLTSKIEDDGEEDSQKG